jgi:predicted phosphate transport protein (TIGR00153 family)
MFGKNRKDIVFYALFAESMGKINEAAELFADLANNYTDVKDKVGKIKEKELDCDLQTHKVLKALNDAFITPFDRDDIFRMIKELDNIVDKIEETANRFCIFRVTVLRPEAIEMVDLILACTKELGLLFKDIESIGKTPFVHDKVVEINRLENIGDAINRQALARLFEEETDPIEIIKWKHLFELLESTVDVCEEVANTIEGLIMKHSD